MLNSPFNAGNISVLSQQHLDFMGSPRVWQRSVSDAPWKREFYTRVLSPLIQLNIEQDFAGREGEDLIADLKNIVENWERPAENGQLIESLNSFEQIAQQSLPGSVTSKFENAEIKNLIKRSYQSLIILEIIYKIEKIAKDNNSIIHDKWIRDNKSKFSLKSYLYIKIKNALNDIFQIKNIYSWLTGTVPHVVSLFLSHLYHGAKGASYFKHSLLRIARATLESAMMPLMLLTGLYYRLFNIISKLVDLPFSLLPQRVPTERWFLKFPLAFLRFSGMIYLSLELTLLTTPLLLPIVGYSVAAYLATYIVGGIGLGLLRKASQWFGPERALFTLSNDEQQDPTLSLKSYATLLISAFFPLKADTIDNAYEAFLDLKHYYNVHKAALTGEGGYFSESKALYKRFQAVDRENGGVDAVLTQEQIENRQQLLTDAMQFCDRLDQFQQNTHFGELEAVKFSVPLIQKISSAFFSVDITSMESAKQAVRQWFYRRLKLPVEALNPANDDVYDQMTMVRRMMRLRQALERGEGDQQLLADLPRNPILFCGQHPRIQDLPVTLRHLAIAPSVAPTSEEVPSSEPATTNQLENAPSL